MISSLDKYRKQRRRKGEYFSDLPTHLIPVARRKFAEYCERARQRGRRLTPWLLASLVAAATSQTVHPSDSAWGRRMLAKKGGHAKHRKDMAEGRDPLVKARYVKKMKANYRKSQKSQEAQNLTHGVTDLRMLGNNPKAKPLVDRPVVEPRFNAPEPFNGYMLHGVPIPPHPFHKH